MCVQADLNRCPMCNVLRAVESLLRGYNALQGGFEEKWNMWLGSGRGIWDPCVVLAEPCRVPARPNRSLSSSIEPYDCLLLKWTRLRRPQRHMPPPVRVSSLAPGIRQLPTPPQYLLRVLPRHRVGSSSARLRSLLAISSRGKGRRTPARLRIAPTAPSPGVHLLGGHHPMIRHPRVVAPSKANASKPILLSAGAAVEGAAG